MISNTKVKTQAVANGSSTSFSYDFLLLDPSHVLVYLNTTLQSTGYTVFGIGSASGGIITFATAPASGTKVTFIRIVPLAQLKDYIANDSFPAETHELALDQLTMIAQQHQEAINRSLHANVTEDDNLELEDVETRRGRILGFDEDGLPISTVYTSTLEALIALNSTALLEGVTDYGSVVDTAELIVDYGTV